MVIHEYCKISMDIRQRCVEIASYGRIVLKSIQSFRTDALIQKVSPELGY